MIPYGTYNSWPPKIYTTCIRSASDGELATYNSYAYCLCNADGSAGTYADLARCGANCGAPKCETSGCFAISSSDGVGSTGKIAAAASSIIFSS